MINNQTPGGFGFISPGAWCNNQCSEINDVFPRGTEECSWVESQAPGHPEERPGQADSMAGMETGNMWKPPGIEKVGVCVCVY